MRTWGILAALMLATGCGSKSTDAPEQAAAPAEKAMPSKPDVIVITLDTTRADHLGSYGYFRDTSPFFDSLAAQGVLFERLVVPMATTLPTHTSMFTGIYPTEHGVLANVIHGGSRFVTRPGVRPLAGWLSEQGYATGGFVSAAPLIKSTGIAEGYAAYTQPNRMERPGDQTTDDAIEWLKTVPEDQPMHMWVHYYDPHNPFRPVPPYDELFTTDKQLQQWARARNVAPSTKRPTGEVVKALPSINAYDGEIRFMDDQIKRLADALKAAGRWDDAVIVFMGDHGEGLNQHGQPGHGLVWDEQLHAPFLILAPGLKARRVAGTVSPVDLLPTLAELTGIEGWEAMAEQSTGMNVLAEGYEGRPVLSQTSARQLMFDRKMSYTLTSDTEKCRWQEGGRDALWDLSADPHELNAVHEGEAFDACIQALKTEFDRQTAHGASLGEARTEKIGDAELEQLKALGYMDDDAAHGTQDTPAQ